MDLPRSRIIPLSFYFRRLCRIYRAFLEEKAGTNVRNAISASLRTINTE